jgi:integrase
MDNLGSHSMPAERLTEDKAQRAQPGISAKTGQKIPKMYNDGKGLLLRVSATGGKYWFYRYKVGGKAHDVGLGSYDPAMRDGTGRYGDGLTLEQARAKAREMRQHRTRGVDPMAVRRREHAGVVAALQAQADVLTFEQVAEKWIEQFERGWSAQHRRDVDSKFRIHVYPVIGHTAVGDVDDDAVLRILDPAGKWQAKPETMARVRSQLENVLAFAMAPQPGRPQGYRPKGDNPARWEGHLQFRLKGKAKITAPEKLAAMRWQDMPAYMAELRANDSFVARALEFTILTAARTEEVLGATWAEIDLEARQWRVPKGRMKAKRDHVVALSEAAVALLRALPGQHRAGDLLFVGRRGKLANNSMTRIIEKCPYKAEDGRRPVVHGFRGTFKTWAKEHDEREDVVEMALAHKSGDEVASRYTHTDLLSHRTRLAEKWARYCGGGDDAKVVPLRA